MGLKRVGERIVDVLVNGNQQASYTQTAERADYDVSVSDNTQTVVVDVAGRFDSVPPNSPEAVVDDLSGLRTADYEPIHPEPTEYRLLGQTVYGDSVRVRVDRADGTSYDETGTGTLDSGWVNYDETADPYAVIYNKTSSNETLEYRLEFKIPVSSGYSIDGVTQS